MEPLEESTPPGLKGGVRSGILAAIKRDVELRGGRTARLLLFAGAMGVMGSIGVTLLLSGHPYGHHPGWHVTFFTAVWAGLLVVALAIALLEIRTPTLPLARAACLGLLGLGIAGICGAICPDQHFLIWWTSTATGASLAEKGGAVLSAMCFGFVATLFVGFVASLLVNGESRGPIKALLPTAVLIVLLLPGVALQSVGTSWMVFLAWLAGTALGAYFGVLGGTHARAWLSGPTRI